VCNFREAKLFITINTRKGKLVTKDSTKYLGVIFDHKLELATAHSTCVKIYIARGIIFKLRNYVPVHVLRNIYFGIVQSYLNYGITSWGNAASKYISKIRYNKTTKLS